MKQSNNWDHLFYPNSSTYDRHKRKLKNWWIKHKASWYSAYVCVMILGFWIYHILLRGWFMYLFQPEGYLIRADNIQDLKSNFNFKPEWGPKILWNEDALEALVKAAEVCHPDELVRLTVRTHPFWLDNTIAYVSSKSYKAKWRLGEEKIYR